MNDQKKENTQTSPEQLLRSEQKRLRKSKRSRCLRAVDRIFGFLLATLFLGMIAGFGLEYVLIKGPSPSLKNAFAMTMFETRRFRWIPNLFMTTEEADALKSTRLGNNDMVFDPSLITINVEPEVDDTDEAPNPYGDYDEDGDGIIIENVSGNGFIGYMIKVLDPSRVFVGRGSAGTTLGDMCLATGALGGINGGAFKDDGGGGSGNDPEGVTIVDGQIINRGYGPSAFAGITAEGLLIVGWYTADEAMSLGVVSGASFGPILISNGVPCTLTSIGSINPRTVIGQRADGAILMLVIDGRQVHSIGANYLDAQNIMLEYGAVNALNLDGGSSTSMWFNGSYVNSNSSANGIARGIPDGFLFR